MTKRKKIITATEKETFDLGKKFALTLKGGEVVALEGDLGSGKTTFSKGVAAGLKVKSVVNSPTFLIMKNYLVKHGQIKQLVHIDCYRLNSEQDLIAIGADQFIGRPHTVSLIEWPQKIKKMLLKKHLVIHFKFISEQQREITFNF